MKCKRCNGTGHETEHGAMRKKRERHSISQADLAAKLRISATYLSDLECGRRDWNTELLEKIEKVLPD